mgnify:CR=1 FL=1
MTKPIQLEEIKKEFEKKFEGFDFYLLPMFVKQVIGQDKDGMKFTGMALNSIELWSFIESSLLKARKDERWAILGRADKKWKTLKQAYEEGRKDERKRIVKKITKLMEGHNFDKEYLVEWDKFSLSTPKEGGR